MSVMTRAGARLLLFGALTVALTTLGAACGGSTPSMSPSTTLGPTTSVSLPAPAGADTIAANYVRFFDGTQPVAAKIGLLENGQQYANELEAQAASPLEKTVSISISSVTVTTPTMAEVKFSILLAGKPAFPDQTGKAIVQDGIWKVAAETFQALLALQQGSTTQSS